MRCKSHAVFWSLLWFSLISELIIFQISLWIGSTIAVHISSTSPLIYCFLDLLRSYYFASKLLIARAICLRWKFSGLIIGETDGRKMPQPPVGVLNICRADMLWEVVAPAGIPREVWWGQWPECSEIQLSMDKRGENCAKSIPASLFQLLLQLQSTASLLQWPCMMLRRWVLSKLLLVIIFHCH